VIGLAHSGWRGTVKRISHNMILKMTKEFGCQKKDIIVGIGPSIGKCHFEVDEPVYNEFYKSFGENIKKICIRGNHEKYYIDLWKANEIVLREAGIIKRNITLANECTYCNEKLYYSHRRDKGKTGSLVAILQLK
jgi:YfiH family protein